MNNYQQKGEVVTLAAPYDRSSGQGALIGALFAVALNDVEEDADGEWLTCGVVVLAKTSAQEWVQGDKIYWDDTNKRADNVATVGPLIGVALSAAANPSSTGVVRLNGVAADSSEGPQTAIADLTFGTNITAATANGSLTDSSATNPTESQFNELAKEVGTKINAILAVMRTRGDIASS